MRRVGPWGKAARVAAAALGLVLAGALVLVLWLSTSPGRHWLGRKIVDRTNTLFKGRLEADEAEYRGGGRVSLEGVRSFGPDGTLAATIERVSAEIDVRSVLRGDIQLDFLNAEGITAQIYPATDGRYPIATAFASRTGGGGGSWGLRRVFATVNHVEYGARRGEPTLVADRGLIRGSLEVGQGIYEFHAEVRALLSAPVAGPVDATAIGRFRHGKLELDELKGILPGGVEIEGTQSSAGARRGWLAAAGPVAPPAGSPGPGESVDVEIEIPREGLQPYGGPVLAGPVRLSAQLTSKGGRVSFDATATPSGPGSILADGWFERGKRGSFEALLDLRGIDPSTILATLPKGRVRLSVEASGALAFPPAAALRGTVRLDRSQLRGAAVGPGRAQFALKGARWSISGLQLQLPGAGLSGGIAVGGAAPLAGGLVLEVADAAALAKAAGEAGLGVPALAGSLHAELDAKEIDGRQGLRLSVRSPSVSIGRTRLRALGLEADLAGDALRVALEVRLALGSFGLDLAAQRMGTGAARLDALALRLPGSSWRLDSPARVTWDSGTVGIAGLALSGPGKLQLDVLAPNPRGGLQGPLEGRLRLADFALAALGPPLTGLKLRGAASGEVELSGSVAAPRLSGDLSVKGLGIDKDRLGDLRASFSLAREALQLHGTLQVEPASSVAVRAQLEARRAAPLWSSEGLRTATGEVNARLDRFDLGALARFGGPQLSGTATGEITLELPLDDPSIRVRLQLAGVEPAGGSLPPFDGRISADSDPRSLSATFDGTLRGFPSLQGHARVGATLRALLSGKSLKGVPLEGQLSLGPGRVTYQRKSLTAASMQASARFSGTVEAPVASLSARVESFSFRGRVAGDLTVEATVDPGKAQGQLRLATREGGSLSADGQYAFGSKTYSAKLVATRASIDVLELLPQVESMEGSEVDGELELSGGAGASHFAGSLTARAKVVTLPDYGRLQDVRLAFGTDGSSLTLRELSFEAAGGRVDASGSLGRSGEDWSVQLKAAFSSFPVPTALAPSAALTTRLDARVVRSDGRLDGRVQLSNGEVRFPEAPGGRTLLPVELPAQFVVHEPSAPPKPPGPSGLEEWLGKERARIRLSVPQGFFVRSPTVTAEVVAEVTADWSTGALELLGRAKALRGDVTLVTRKFEIRRFEADFTGTPTVNPSLDGVLGFSARDVDIEVAIGGTLHTPTIEFRSDPPLEPDQIALMIASGSSQTTQAINPEQLVVAGALNLVAGQLRDALATALPIDVLEVEIGPHGETQRLEAGTYVTRKLFLAFVRNLFPQPGANFNEVLAEFQLRRSLSLQARYGDRQAGSLELFWERRFRSSRQRSGANAELPAEAPADRLR